MQEINPIKEEILESAKKVFAKYGYKKTSVNDIAKAAGKAKSSLYHYFDGSNVFLFSGFPCAVDFVSLIS